MNLRNNEPQPLLNIPIFPQKNYNQTSSINTFQIYESI